MSPAATVCLSSDPDAVRGDSGSFFKCSDGDGRGNGGILFRRGDGDGLCSGERGGGDSRFRRGDGDVSCSDGGSLFTLRHEAPESFSRPCFCSYFPLAFVQRSNIRARRFVQRWRNSL